MKSKVTLLKSMYYMPAVVGSLRCVITLVILIWNPQHMSFRLLQVFPLLVLLFTLFSYMKLYSDGDPVVSLLLPTIVQFLAILLFKRTLEIVPFIVPLLLDVIFLVVKGIKAEAFPFEIEGDEENEDDFHDLESEE